MNPDIFEFQHLLFADIMDNILGSVSKCPVVIRRVFQRLLRQCERKWAGGSALHIFGAIYEVKVVSGPAL